MHRVTFINTTCRRCGKPVVRADRPIVGTQADYDRWGGICSDCTTPAERSAMLAAIGQAILGRTRL